LANFWLGIAQTAIGSALGFGFGIWAFHYQQRKQATKKEKDDWKAAVGALNRLSTAAGANIEALANTKLQFINDMKPEVEKMKAAVVEAYDTPPANRARKISDLKTLSESMRHFYMSLPRTSAMPPPNFGEYSLLSKDMPALMIFVHRATGMMEQLNELISARNELIADHARESGIGAGMSANRLLFFSSMLAGNGEGIYMHVDDALDFWRLVLDQLKAFVTAKAGGEYFLEYKLVPKAVEAMPKEELFPLMRSQLTTFESRS
jgi:hypothetical protein